MNRDLKIFPCTHQKYNVTGDYFHGVYGYEFEAYTEPCKLFHSSDRDRHGSGSRDTIVGEV
jgi:hypothetical protein